MTETTTKPPPADPWTGQGLIEFLDAAIDKGFINVGTAKALKTASLKILSVESGWENLDLRSLDVDGLYERFRNLKRNDYSDDTMRIYRGRLGQALRCTWRGWTTTGLEVVRAVRSRGFDERPGSKEGRQEANGRGRRTRTSSRARSRRIGRTCRQCG
jgi:ribosomal protein S21